MSYVKLKVKGLSQILGSDNLMLVMLVDEAEKRQLVVPCDHQQAYQLRLRMEHHQVVNTKHLLPEILIDLLPPSIKSKLRVEIFGLQEGKYLSCLHDMETDEKKEIRCTDGILFSIINKIPIYIDADLMGKQSAEYHAGYVQMPVPVNVITDKMLEDSLRKAIDNENYELASNLRDELKKRHPDTDKPDNKLKTDL
nr:UvrB/UvrC motif-containing protein [Prevotella sp.]